MTLEPERRQAAILYAELRNFTRLSEMLAPDKVLELANDFFSLCAMGVTANAGKVLSVQNDMLVAAFAAEKPRDFASRALKAAQQLQTEFGTIGGQWKADFGLPAAVSLALQLGEAVFCMAGPIGPHPFFAFCDCNSGADRPVRLTPHGDTTITVDFRYIPRT